MGKLLQDLRYGLRMLAGKPGFTSVAVLTLALGIGANTAIFSVVYGVIIKPLPYRNSDQLVRLYSEFPNFPGGGLRRFQVSGPEFLELRRDAHSWETMGAWATYGANLTGSTEPIRVQAAFVSGTLLQSLAIAPIRGRLIVPDDDAPGATRVGVISEGLWKRAFGSDPSLIGRDILFNGTKCTIVGIMPQDFDFPAGEVNPTEIWVPIQIDPANPGGRSSHGIFLLGRMKPGITISRARDEMSQLLQHYRETAPAKTHTLSPDRHPVVMYPLKDEVISNVRPALLMLLSAVFFVLLIACVNVANLLLARAEVRQREIALRTALGATRGRLVRQFVTEGALLALGGGAAGLLLAFGGLRLMVATNAGLVPRVEEVSLNAKTMLLTLAICLLTGMFFGLAPLAHVKPANLNDSLKSSAGRSTASAAARMFRRILVTGEIALALVLLVGSGLMVRGFWKLLQVNPGITTSGLLTMEMALPQTSYPDNKSLLGFWNRLKERLSALPGVESADLATELPPQRPIDADDTEFEGLPKGPDAPVQNVDYWVIVTPGAFKTMRMKLIEGRFLENSDGDGAQPVVVINQTMARHFYGNQSPIGRRIRMVDGEAWRTIVGVVADVKNAGMDRPAGTELYVPYAQATSLPYAMQTFFAVLRTSRDPLSLTNSATEAVHSLDPALPVSHVTTMDDLVSAAESRPRFLTLLLGLFSGLALVLATVGIYGLMSYAVTQRTQEIGIRMALGARPGDVQRMVLFHGLGITLSGLAVGVAAAFGLTRLMASLLFGVTATDPLTFVVIVVALAVAAIGACYVPARRATAVDPMIALRYE